MRPFILFSLALALIGCARQPGPVAPVTITSVEIEPALRTCRVVLHVDDDLPDDANLLVVKAANAWRSASDGHIDIDPVFDFNGDYKSDQSTLHVIASDSTLCGELDEELAHDGRIPVAATASLHSGTKRVYLIVDRIDESSALHTVSHELGHVCGLPDLPTHGAVMTAVDDGTPLEDVPTEIDLSVCRSLRLCP